MVTVPLINNIINKKLKSCASLLSFRVRFDAEYFISCQIKGSYTYQGLKSEVCLYTVY